MWALFRAGFDLAFVAPRRVSAALQLKRGPPLSPCRPKPTPLSTLRPALPRRESRERERQSHYYLLQQSFSAKASNSYFRNSTPTSATCARRLRYVARRVNCQRSPDLGHNVHEKAKGARALPGGAQKTWSAVPSPQREEVHFSRPPWELQRQEEICPPKKAYRSISTSVLSYSTFTLNLVENIRSQRLESAWKGPNKSPRDWSITVCLWNGKVGEGRTSLVTFDE